MTLISTPLVKEFSMVVSHADIVLFSVFRVYSWGSSVLFVNFVWKRMFPFSVPVAAFVSPVRIVVTHYIAHIIIVNM